MKPVAGLGPHFHHQTTAKEGQFRPLSFGGSWVDRQVWTNLNTGEVFPDVMTPITAAMIECCLKPLFGSVFRLVGADPSRAPVLGLVAGRLYFNVNTGLAALRPFGWLLTRSPKYAHVLGGGPVDWLERGVLGIASEDLPDVGFRWPKYILSWPRLVFELATHLPGRAEDWMARVKARNDALARRDFAALATPDLAGELVKLVRDEFDGWDLLHLLPQSMALPLFEKACRDWLGDPDLALGYRLFSALEGMPEVEIGLALWRLAALADGQESTKATLLADADWEQVSARLEDTEDGRRFLTAWDAFMHQHGHHCRGEHELSNARWAETPDYILGMVRGYVRTIGQSNLPERQRQLAEERQGLTAGCRARLSNPVKRWLFSRALSRAQKLAVTREEWKNQAVRHAALLRRLLLILGDRFQQQGILSQRDDVFFLDLDEIESLATSRNGPEIQAAIRERRTECEKNRRLAPPPIVIGRFVPDIEPARAPVAMADSLVGTPVYPGTVTGPARVILRANNGEQVLAGEILVVPFTDPAWTPYFVPAAGVVMDQGGILSHGSIIAREYGLPAVTNVGWATRVIRTGDLVRVDGTCGRVTILERVGAEP